MNSQFQINTITNSGIAHPSITVLKNNKNFVITWDNTTNTYIQILTDNGTKIGSQLNITSGSALCYSSITSLANSNFVVTYRCLLSICAQIFYSNGTILKPQFTVFGDNWAFFHQLVLFQITIL